VGGAPADADSVGTLQVNGTFNNNFSPVTCPAGTPATTACHANVSVRANRIPGLGVATVAPFTLFLDDFASACTRLHAQIPILVAGKGEIDLAMPSTGCITPDQLARRFPPIDVTVSGGSDRYAGASGSGVLTFQNTLTGLETGHALITWTGTLNVAGLSFDTTPPQIAGARSKTAKTRRARGARVRYSVSAVDARDGPVPAVCRPKSGSVFRVGRTRVTCTAADGSGNTATARFIITVKGVRR
jgi:HYR domain-containing protein